MLEILFEITYLCQPEQQAKQQQQQQQTKTKILLNNE